jgi:pimeloyl-ACP methyl ester carboxylesterase
MADFPSYRDLLAGLPTIHCIAGQRDPTTPPELMAEIPTANGKPIVVDGAGHMLPLTHPKEVAAALRAHWDATPPSERV